MSTAFRISLDGAQQVPVVMSSASGLGTAIFDSITTSMTIRVNVRGLDWGPLLMQPPETMSLLDDVNGVHIHNAARGVNGAIVLDWPSGGDADDFAVSGVLMDGSRNLTSIWETTDNNPITPFAATFAGATFGADVPFYMNIHTGANPGGEIRGQLVTIATDNGETVNGTGGDDILPGLAGDDALVGLAGNDSLDGGAGADAMFGGQGDDSYVVGAGDGVIENANEGTDTVTTSISYVLTANVENLVLQGDALTSLQGYGNGLANNLTGSAGANLLDGLGGVDTMTGGLGDDAYFVDDFGDQVIENGGEGNDTVFSSAANFQLSANVESLVLQGIASLNGTGNGMNNVLQGNIGSNILDGLAGADALFGGAGNDTYFVDGGDGVFENAGEGIDTVVASINYALTADVEILMLQGGAMTPLQGYGNILANSLIGSAGANLLDGQAGADTMAGALGDDVYFVDQSGDVVTENLGEGNDTVFLTAAFLEAVYQLPDNVDYLVLQASQGVQLTGNALGNQIYGNIGGDVIRGGLGPDLINGGGGTDTILLNPGEAAGDFIFDFDGTPGSDDLFVATGFGPGATVTAAGGGAFRIDYVVGGMGVSETFNVQGTFDPLTDFTFL